MVTTVLIIALGVYAAAMTYLRATAPKTVTTVDDKLLAIGEKAAVIVGLIQEHVDAAEKAKTDAK